VLTLQRLASFPLSRNPGHTPRLWSLIFSRIRWSPWRPVCLRAICGSKTLLWLAFCCLQNRLNELGENFAIEFLGIWEQINNPGFNPIEFDGIKKVAGLNSFTLTPKQWIELSPQISTSM
jgi:hypothetical protein